MTAEQEKSLTKEIGTLVERMSMGNPILKEEIKELINNLFSTPDDYVIVTWPEIQFFMDKEGFDLNASLANDEWVLEEYGSSAYFIRKDWLKQYNYAV